MGKTEDKLFYGYQWKGIKMEIVVAYGSLLLLFQADIAPEIMLERKNSYQSQHYDLDLEVLLD